MLTSLVVYQGGHPEVPRRQRGLNLSVTANAVLVHTAGNKVVLSNPVDTLFAVRFPHATDRQVDWNPETQRLIRGCKNAMVLGTRINEINHFVVFDMQSNIAHLYSAMRYAVAHSPIAEAEMHDYRSYEWEWIAENGDYVGGHPRFPQSQKVVRLGITPWELTAWSAQGHLMFSLPVETIQAVTTQFAQTSGAFLGLGAEGILEASVANVLTRKNHHGVLISAHIDQKLCAVGFDFPGLTAQLRIYDAIQARLAERLPSANTSEALSSNVAEQLREVVQLYREGFLDATEFQQAKQWILNGI